MALLYTRPGSCLLSEIVVKLIWKKIDMLLEDGEPELEGEFIGTQTVIVEN